ncbi:MAG: 2-phosphosulfolactate phosphatase [Planctomycetes bacterium]|nr:2-phosphosulfolactate phosphatase [Planctomycetota bacterium]
MPELNVHYLPQFVAESELAGSVVVVVDLLRASTTICHALASGANSVVPCLEIDEAWAKAKQFSRDEIVLGGERGGEQIEGFDLGNSPADYTADQVFGRTVLFTTTNGTRALAHARLASRVFIGAANNRAALVETLADSPRIDILCAGTDGKITREDNLAAGAICDGLLSQASASPWQTNEWAQAALGEWQELKNLAQAEGRTASEQLALELCVTPGGMNLLVLGYDTDLVLCAQLDTLDVVPEMDLGSGELRLP